jgi:tight adherence protein C
MTTFALIVGLIFLAVAVMLLVGAFSTQRTRGGELLGQIDAYGFRGYGVPDEVDRGKSRSALAELPASMGAMLSRRLGGTREADVKRRLVAAGWYTTSPTAFMGYQLLGAIGITFVWLWLGGLSGASPVVFAIGIVCAAAFGWYLPSMVINRKTAQRHHQIDYELPELIDLLVVTVEAGVGFNGSLRLAAQQLDGPLAQELRLTLQEQSMGLSTAEALENMAGRAPSPGVRGFVRTIAQGETLGVSIGQILRNLADEMRKRRRARAEELAQKAPVKMLFPLIFLIFPAMFVVLLLPALIQITKTLGG